MYQRPSLSSFVKGYLCGKFLLVNTVIFIMMAIDSGSLFMPTTEVVLQYGAKESLLLVSGEWWRLFTPMFVHIGLIHFLFNSYAIYFLGIQLEPMVGKRWMAVIYIVSGVCGNIASALFTFGISAGASSSIFGLLGLGLILERAIGKHVEKKTGQKVKTGMYTSLVLINLVLGFVIPAIDNAAHIGGLVGGLFLTVIMLYVAPNRLQKRRIFRGAFVASLLALLMGSGAYFACSATFAAQRYEEFGDNSVQYPDFALNFYSRAIMLQPGKADLYLKRARLLVDTGALNQAVKDLFKVLEITGEEKQVEEYLESLRNQGRSEVYEKLLRELGWKSI